MKKAFASFLFLLAFLSYAEKPGAPTPGIYYVSPLGDDRWSGLLPEPNEDKTDGPFLSLSMARDAVRATVPELPRKIILRGGTHFLDTPLVLGKADSGEEGNPVRYLAYPDEIPIVSGGIPITNWKREGKKIYSAPLPPTTGKPCIFRQLRLGNSMQTLARHPNKIRAGKRNNRPWIYAANQPNSPGNQLIFHPGDIPPWNLAGAHIVLFPGSGRTGGPLQILQADRARNLIELERNPGTDRIAAGNRYRLENLRQALDAPGEFFVDTKKNKILFFPESSAFAEQQIVVPHLKTLIACNNTGTDGAQYIEFSNLHFRDTCYTLSANNFNQPDDAAIRLENARDITFTKCAFSKLGGYGIRLGEKVENCQITLSSFSDLGQGGILVRRQDQAPRKNRITACTFSEVGRIYAHCAAIEIHGGKGAEIAHCDFSRLPGSAIRLGSAGTATATDCHVSYNDIRQTSLATNYCGAIEVLGSKATPTRHAIEHNRIDNSSPPAENFRKHPISHSGPIGMHLANYSSGNRVYGNLLVGNQRGGILCSFGAKNQILNNILIGGAQPQVEWSGDSSMRQNSFVNNIIVQTGSPRSYLHLFGPPPEDLFSECDRNLIFWPGKKLEDSPGSTPAGSWEQWRETGFDENSLIADPEFKTGKGNDYVLKAQSPAWKLGFRKISVEKMGTSGFKEK